MPHDSSKPITIYRYLSIEIFMKNDRSLHYGPFQLIIEFLVVDLSVILLKMINDA